MPVVALFLESLPYGAVLIFKDFPDRTIRTTYSYFSPTPWGYANFPPGITALLTCVLLMAAILAAAKDSRKALLRVFGISLAAAAISPMQLLYNINNFSVTGCLITVTLAAECEYSQGESKKNTEPVSLRCRLRVLFIFTFFALRAASAAARAAATSAAFFLPAN